MNCWQITLTAIAAISASVTLLFKLYSVWQVNRWKKILPRMLEIKTDAVNLQNDNSKDLSEEELLSFEKQVNDVKASLISEISKVSKTKANRYELYGLVPLFQNIKNEKQRKLLGVATRTWQIADEILDKYS